MQRFFCVEKVRLSFVQPLSLASLDSSPSRGASGGEENFELGRKTLRNAKASPRQGRWQRVSADGEVESSSGSRSGLQTFRTALDFWGEWHIIKVQKKKQIRHRRTQKERPPPGAAISERGSFLVLTALQPSVKPLADVVGRYICCDGQNKRKNIRHQATPPFSHPWQIGRDEPQDYYII